MCVRDKLGEIVAFYEGMTQIKVTEYRTAVFGLVANALNEISGRGWGWRYIHNVHKGSQQPSRFLAPAIERLHATMVANKPVFSPAPVCPTCNLVHVTKRCPTKNGDTHRGPRHRVDLGNWLGSYAAEQAAAQGVTLSEWVRRLIVREAGR